MTSIANGLVTRGYSKVGTNWASTELPKLGGFRVRRRCIPAYPSLQALHTGVSGTPIGTPSGMARWTSHGSRLHVFSRLFASSRWAKKSICRLELESWSCWKVCSCVLSSCEYLAEPLDFGWISESLNLPSMRICNQSWKQDQFVSPNCTTMYHMYPNIIKHQDRHLNIICQESWTRLQPSQSMTRNLGHWRIKVASRQGCSLVSTGRVYGHGSMGLDSCPPHQKSCNCWRVQFEINICWIILRSLLPEISQIPIHTCHEDETFQFDSQLQTPTRRLALVTSDPWRADITYLAAWPPEASGTAAFAGSDFEWFHFFHLFSSFKQWLRSGSWWFLMISRLFFKL